MGVRFRLGAAPLLAAALASCAAQTVLVDDTRSFVSAGHAAGDEAAAFFDAARERQLEANALLVASDPGCQWGSYLYLRRDPAPGQSLCASGTDAVGATRYSLRPIGAAAGAPAAQLIAAMTAYVGELARLEPDQVPEFEQAVADAKVRVGRLQTALDGAARLDPGRFGAAAGALKGAGSRYLGPAEAVAGLLDFFDGLARTSREAGAIRAYVAAHGDAFEAAVDALSITMEAWRTGIVESSGQVARDALITGTNRALAGTGDFERRRALLSQLIVALQAQSREDAGFARASEMLSDLRAQHAALRAFSEGRYDAADRRRIARVQEEQAWALLDRVGAIASAVAGAS